MYFHPWGSDSSVLGAFVTQLFQNMTNQYTHTYLILSIYCAQPHALPLPKTSNQSLID